MRITQMTRAVLPQEPEYPAHEQIDLYDDVISPSANNGDAPEDREYLDALPTAGGSDGGKSAPPAVYSYTGKRIALYIGNLTWVGVNHPGEPKNLNKDSWISCFLSMFHLSS